MYLWVFVCDTFSQLSQPFHLSSLDRRVHLIHYEYTDVNQTFASVVERRVSDPLPYFFVTSPSLRDPSHLHAPDGTYSLEIIRGLDYDHGFTLRSGMTSRRPGEAYEQLKRRVEMSLVRSAECYISILNSHLYFIEFAMPLSNDYWDHSMCGEYF